MPLIERNVVRFGIGGKGTMNPEGSVQEVPGLP